jgi:hypothetical protein
MKDGGVEEMWDLEFLDGVLPNLLFPGDIF